MTCTNCGKELEEGILFCDACGTKVLQEAPQAEYAAEETTYVEQEFAPEAEAIEAPAPKAKKKLIPIIAAALAVVVIAVVAILIFGGKGNITKPILYVKDKEMMIAGKGEPWQITSDLGKTYSYGAMLAPDGKTLFYADKLEDGDTPIYFRDITKKNSEPQKLDTDIEDLYISKNSKLVVYKSDGALYRHDLTDKTKIASDVDYVCAITDDCKTVIYMTEADEDEKPDLYIDKNGEQEKLASEVSSFEYANEKCSVVYYTSDDVLYKLKVGGEKEKIDDEISSVARIYESGEMYYFKSEKKEVKEGDFSYETQVFKLFYNDGSEAVSLAEDLDYPAYRSASEAAVLIYSEYKTEGEGEEAKTVATTYVAVESNVTALDFEDDDTDYSNCRLSKDGKVLYYTDSFSEKDATFDLYTAEISGGAPGTAELYDSDIAAKVEEYSTSAIFSLFSDGTVIYGKDLKDGTYDLYIDQELVEYDVKDYDYYVDDETIVYETDYKDGACTLNIWVKGKKSKVAEEVDDYQYCNNGKLIYLADCNDNGKGDLYEYRKGNSEKIDEDVTAIVHCSIVSYDD